MNIIRLNKSIPPELRWWRETVLYEDEDMFGCDCPRCRTLRQPHEKGCNCDRCVHHAGCKCQVCGLKLINASLRQQLKESKEVAEERREQRDKLKKEVAEKDLRIQGLKCMLEHHGHRFFDDPCEDVICDHPSHSYSHSSSRACDHDHHDRGSFCGYY